MRERGELRSLTEGDGVFHRRAASVRRSAGGVLPAFSVGLALLLGLLLGPSADCAEKQLVADPPHEAVAAQQDCGDRASALRKGAFIEGGTACFYGLITRESADKFLELPIPDGMPLVLDSGGGDVASALDMAERILDRHLPVVVSGACLSSCANYLFPAGATKVVLPNSYLGWHGGPAKTPPPTLNEQARSIRQHTMDKQEMFFRRVGVNDSLIYNPPPGSGINQENRANKFWTWGADDLRKKFGVQGILWMWEPKPSRPAASQQ